MNTQTDTRKASGTITADIDALRRVMPALKKVAGGRVPVPCLGWLRFADGTVSAFDFDTSITAHIGVGDLSGAVRYVDFANAVSILPRRGTVELATSEDGSSVTIGAVRMPSQDVADLPALPDMAHAGHVVALTPAHMAEALRVAAAASTDNTLPMLCSVQVSPTGMGDFTLAATDRYRLHHAQLSGDMTGDASVFLDAKTLGLVAKVTKGQTVKVYAKTEHELVSYRSEGVEITHRSSQSEFPRWQSLVPKDVETFTADRAALMSAVKAAGKVLTRTAPLRIEGNAQGFDVVAYVDNVETLRIPVRSCGTPVDYVSAFNPAYLGDALAALTGDTVTVGFNDAKRPHTFTGGGDGLTDTLVMPVRIQG